MCLSWSRYMNFKKRLSMKLFLSIKYWIRHYVPSNKIRLVVKVFQCMLSNFEANSKNLKFNLIWLIYGKTFLLYYAFVAYGFMKARSLTSRRQLLCFWILTRINGPQWAGWRKKNSENHSSINKNRKTIHETIHT